MRLGIFRCCSWAVLTLGPEALPRSMLEPDLTQLLFYSSANDITSAHGECQMAQPAAASSQGEKSLRSTLEVFNDQRNWAVESAAVRVTEGRLAQAFGNGFVRASKRRGKEGTQRPPPRSARAGPTALSPGAPARWSTGRHHPQAGPSSQQALQDGGTGAARCHRSATSSAEWQRPPAPPGAWRVARARSRSRRFRPRPTENSYSKCQQNWPLHNAVPASLSPEVSPVSCPRPNIISFSV